MSKKSAAKKSLAEKFSICAEFVAIDVTIDLGSLPIERALLSNRLEYNCQSNLEKTSRLVFTPERNPP